MCRCSIAVGDPCGPDSSAVERGRDYFLAKSHQTAVRQIPHNNTDTATAISRPRNTVSPLPRSVSSVDGAGMTLKPPCVRIARDKKRMKGNSQLQAEFEECGWSQ
jgi:hypothetical protein